MADQHHHFHHHQQSMSPWMFDPGRRLYYRCHRHTGDHLYQDGTRVPGSADPLSLSPRYHVSASSSSSCYKSSAVPLAPGQALPRAAGLDVVQSLHSLSLEPPEPDARNTNPGQPQVSQSRWSTYHHKGVQMVEANNPTTRVTTLFGTGPLERITDPQLLARGIRAHRMLLGTGVGDAEPMYPNFRLRKRDFFSVGRVFHVLWAEPAGETRTLVTNFEMSHQDPAMSTGRHGQAIFSKVRLFVVVRAGPQYCSALPVMSYGHRGVGKPGVVKHEHAIIHTGSRPPQPCPEELPARGELPMRSEAIRVIPDHPAEKLDPMSRIGFLRVHTVQHNIKAKPFGMVHPDSIQSLVTQFMNVWSMSLSPTSLASSGLGPQPLTPTVTDGNPARPTGKQPPTPPPLPRPEHGYQKPRRKPGMGHDEEDEEEWEGSDTRSQEQDNEKSDSDINEESDSDINEEESEDRIPAKDRKSELLRGVGSQWTKDTRELQNSQAAKQAREGIERLRQAGYSPDHAFVIVMGKLQADRNLTYDHAYRLLYGWTGYRLSV